MPLKFQVGLVLTVLLACAGKAPGAGDAGPIRYAPDPVYAKVERTARYVTMHDGTRIALDLYLPADRGARARLPALLYQTRYWRSVELRWPLGSFMERPNREAEFFVKHGYAYVSVDVRGSGASFGTRPFPWAPAEVGDGGEIIDWIVAQPWSNGRVVAAGASYDGTTAELVALDHRPALKAIAPLFSLFDAYSDIAFFGGIPNVHFLKVWSAANQYLDRDALPPIAGWLNRLLVQGVRPVAGDRATLAEAIREHAGNGDVRSLTERAVFRDDRPSQSGTSGVSAALLSPRARAAEYTKLGLPEYSWSGWFDAEFARAAVERFLTVRTLGSRLLLGPWNHGGSFSGSPTSAGASRFDLDGELLRFFDPVARGIETGSDDDAPVLYYTMVEDRWKSARTWPPAAAKWSLYLGEGGALQERPNRAADATDRYRVDYTAGTGSRSRWDTLMTSDPVIYDDRARRDRKLLTYTLAPLEADVEVTGHPVVTLDLSSSAEDGAFFAYLEDVSPAGEVTYVTEGALRGIHRALSSEKDVLRGIVPIHSYRRADALPLVPGKIAELRFDLIPVSYLFKRGHSVRLALAGADVDHFALIPKDHAPTWQVHRGARHPSRIDLPVVSRKSRRQAKRLGR